MCTFLPGDFPSRVLTCRNRIIATPGRLLHLIVEMNLDLKSVQYVVFDEADRLFEMGFETALTEILHRLPPTRQTLLFSATLPKSLVEFAKAGLQNPKLVRLDAESKISPDLKMAFFSVKQAEKDDYLGRTRSAQIIRRKFLTVLWLLPAVRRVLSLTEIGEYPRQVVIPSRRL